MDVKLPNLGEGADSGTVVKVLVKEGDRIEKEQPVIELENEKAVASIPSSAAGTVGKIHVKEGDKISVGQRILSVKGGDGGEKEEAEKEEAGEEKPKEKEREKEAKAEEPEEGKEGEAEEEKGKEEAQPGVEVAAAPSIRKLARELGIDLSRIRGSERGGRIVMGDLRAYVKRLQKLAAEARGGEKAKAPAAAIDFSQWGEIVKKPMSQLRKVISRRMAENWTTIPHVTQFDDADVTGILELRKKYVQAYEQKGTKLTLTSFVLKAVVETLKKHPIFNSSLDEAAQEIVLKEYYHIGIAVDTDAGLIVPVIRDVDKKSLLELSKDLEELAKKARERKVSADEMKGGTFTISNQGGIGGAHFTPIVNKPEVAILGLGRGELKPVVKDKQVVTRTMLPLGLSYDHRVIDGGSAARFTVDLVEALENFSEDSVKL